MASLEGEQARGTLNIVWKNTGLSLVFLLFEKSCSKFELGSQIGRVEVRKRQICTKSLKSFFKFARFFCICSLFVVARTVRRRKSVFLGIRLLLFEAKRESDERKHARYTYIVYCR